MDIPRGARFTYGQDPEVRVAGRTRKSIKGEALDYVAPDGLTRIIYPVSWASVHVLREQEA